MSAAWYAYVRKQFLCPNCYRTLEHHADGQCLAVPGTYFELTEELVVNLLHNEGEDVSMENVRRRKAVLEADFRKGVL